MSLCMIKGWVLQRLRVIIEGYIAKHILRSNYQCQSLGAIFYFFFKKNFYQEEKTGKRERACLNGKIEGYITIIMIY